MTIRNLIAGTTGAGLLLLTACEAPRNMRDDFLKLTSSQPAAQKSKPAKSGSTPPRATPLASTTDVAAVVPPPPSDEPLTFPTATAASDTPAGTPAFSLGGKSEAELRATLGAPASEEERPPGKLWLYRDGQCALVVQLYPDVQTKQFRVLAYEVKSYDSTDEGKRMCTAQMQSRATAAH
jgi:hypothetical protein